MTDGAAHAPHAWRPRRFMVIVAHPDDADFGPAATAARWIDLGSEGWLVCCTSGDAGADDWRTDPLELAALREAEQRAAADVVGYAGISFLHQPDGALVNDLALREQLVREIRTIRPDAVLAVDPETLLVKVLKYVVVHDCGRVINPLTNEEAMSTLLIVLLVLFVLGGGGWGYSRYRR